MRIALLAGLAILVAAGLYTGLTWQANPGRAAEASPGTESAASDDIAALREGDMLKLAIHPEPVAGSDVAFTGEDGSEMTLAAYGGDIVVLNFWATWCAPCRAEMPTLDALQRDLADEGVAVVTIATGRNPPQAMERFFDEVGVESLPLHRDPRQALARDMGVLGLPVTLILDREGQELARLTGEADWSSDSARAVVAAFAAAGG